MNQLHLSRRFRIFSVLAPAVLLSGSAPLLQAAYVAGLDGLTDASTLSNQGVTPLGAGLLGWTDILGEARFFQSGGDGVIIHNSEPYGNYTVQYAPPAAVSYQPNSLYALTFDMGYVAGNGDGFSEYTFSLGVIDGGVYQALATSTGNVPYTGNMHSTSTHMTPATLSFSTGAAIPAGALAIRWGQTSTTGVPDSSDFFGFNRVILEVNPVPEPSGALLLAGAGFLAAGARGRRRPRHHASGPVF